MASAIIHFGMHKTGSSSIQQSLAERLDDSKFRYLSLGSSNSSGSIAVGFRRNPENYHGSKKRGSTREDLRLERQAIHRNLTAALTSNDARKATPILSAEYVSVMKAGEFGDLCDFFGRHGYDVTAVGYVRSPKGFMESAFQQRLKGGYKAFDVANMYPDYRRNFEKFESVLGKERVRLWHFDTESFPGGCVVQDFCGKIGIRFRPQDVIRVNEGMSLPALSLLYAYRKFGPGYGVGATVIRENHLLNTKVAELRGPKLRFHSSLVAPVIEAEREDIAWMEQRLGTSLAEDLARDDGRAIRSEEELLTFAPESLQWLAEQLGPDYTARWRPDMSAQQVADWMHAMRVKLANEDERLQGRIFAAAPARNNGGDMTITDLVQRARQSAPQKLKDISDEAAAVLLREAFALIGKQIASTDEGMVKVAGLGQFRVRKVEATPDGVKAATRRTLFKAEP